MKYKILYNESRPALEEDVNTWLAEGWQLSGGVAIGAMAYTYERCDGVRTVEKEVVFAQAMVKPGGVA
jgi:hypothetical protein